MIIYIILLSRAPCTNHAARSDFKFKFPKKKNLLKSCDFYKIPTKLGTY